MVIKASFLISGFWLAWALIVASPVQAQQFDWQEIELPEDVKLTDVAASPGRLIAVGYAGAPGFRDGVAYTSINGLDWQLLDIDAIGVLLGVVAFAQGQWLIGRADGSLYRSVDGINWSVLSLPDGLRSDWNSILEINNEIWLVGNGGGANARIISSTELSNWQLVYENATGFVGGPELGNVVGASQKLVALARDPIPSVQFIPRLYFSTDGTDWDSDSLLAFDTIWDGEKFRAITFWEPPLNPIAELTPGGDWIFPAFSNAAEIRYSTIAVNRDYLLLEGRTELTPKSIVISSDGGNHWVEQDISELNPEGTTREMIAWQDGWVGVGDSIIFGSPQQPQTVPALSAWAVQVLGLLLILIAFFALRRGLV